MSGTLYLCATPIGNLEDITYRVVRTLQEVDLIAAEDTRNSLKLLRHFGIERPLTSYHEHNQYEKGHRLIEKMLRGQNIALITDAGTPGISDPGEVLVRLCYEAGIRVTSLPGPAACVTALTMSGLSARRFAFEAFLPADKKERECILQELKRESRTIVLYEAPHRLVRTLALLAEYLGEERNIALCRELTKCHETVFRGTLQEAISFYEKEPPRGEFVLIVAGVSRQALLQQARGKWEAISLEEHMDRYLSAGHEKKEAMRLVARDRGISRREVYQDLEAKKALRGGLGESGKPNAGNKAGQRGE